MNNAARKLLRTPIARIEPQRIFVLKAAGAARHRRIKALRMALKQLLRWHELRCVSVHEEIADNSRTKEMNDG